MTNRVQLDYNAQCLTVDGVPVRLTRNETDIMYVFTKDPPFLFSAHELADKVWGSRWPANVGSSVTYLIMSVRRKLMHTALTIVTKRGRGYGMRLAMKGT